MINAMNNINSTTWFNTSKNELTVKSQTNLSVKICQLQERTAWVRVLLSPYACVLFNYECATYINFM